MTNESLKGEIERFGLSPIRMAFRDSRGTEEVTLYHERGVASLIAHIHSQEAKIAASEAERDRYREALERARYLIDFAPTKEEGTTKAYEVISEALSPSPLS